jgi:sulfatase modifying factor 1
MVIAFMNKLRLFLLFIILQFGAILCLNAQEKGNPNSGNKSSGSAESVIDKLQKNMVLVEGGTFMMGCLNPDDTDCHDLEKPAHKVRVNSFYINKYNVTVKEFEVFIKESGYQTDADKTGFSFIYTKGDFTKTYGINWKSNAHGHVCTEAEMSYPVTQVTWNDAQEFCRWLSKKTGKKFRLAAEAEFEFAAKGGNKSQGYKYAGSNNINEVAWYNANCGDSSLNPVGRKKPNELGLYDMSGNVWQICNDWYVENYYQNSPVGNPKGPATGTHIIVRGGSWRRGPERCQTTSRHYDLPDARHSNLGFRIAEDL